jgi:hypothetical protein
MGSEKERVGVGREIALLEKKLADVQVWEERVRELEEILSVRAERKEGERESFLCKTRDNSLPMTLCGLQRVSWRQHRAGSVWRWKA